MFPIHWKKFLHPGGVYGLEYPDFWDQVTKDDARSCGFGPHDRDDVGLWISLMPVSVDTDRLAEELPKILNQVLPQMEGGNVRRDPALRHYGVKADVHKDGEGGHYWLIAGGDVVLFAPMVEPAVPEFAVHFGFVLPEQSQVGELFFGIAAVSEIDDRGHTVERAAGELLLTRTVRCVKLAIEPGILDHVADSAGVVVVRAERAVFIFHLDGDDRTAAMDL